jgi:probable regulatory domain-containing protein
LAEYRTLTWLPSLARAAFVIVLREEYVKSELEIAEFVGLTKNTVRNILRADPQLALYKLKHLEELTAEQKKELKVHIA